MALLGAAVAVGPLHACTAGPGREDVAVQRLETQLCEKARECECSRVDELIECGGWPPESYDYEGLDRAALAFDPTCVEAWTSWLDTLSCQAPVLPPYADVCPLYHGTLRAGDPCQQSSRTETDCGPRLLCIAGLCRDPQRTAFGGPSQPCDLGNACDDGLACIEAVCERLPGAGEPCLGGRCSADARCSDILCVALPGPGEPCPAGDCRPEAFCSVDASTGIAECLHAGDVGEPCRGHRECVSGNCPAGVCEDPAEVGDACSDQLPCGPSQYCAEGSCQAEGDGAVPSGSACGVLEGFWF
jgi:hypothetical protein